MRGMMPLTIAGEEFLIAGGPYEEKPPWMIGVKLAPEKEGEFRIELPTQDFGVPDVKSAQIAVRETLRLVANGEPVYAGCAAGIGRTGTFLALLAKATCDPKSPDGAVSYVRKHYYGGAVETGKQVRFIESFPVFRLRLMLLGWTIRRALFGKKARV